MAAATDPATDLLPDHGDRRHARACARGSPHAVRAEVDRRKRRQQLIDYDDMLIRLSDTLTDPTSGPVAQGRLRDALSGGAGRRVPGHRPGAVGDPARGVPRAPHPGADRRPEAGHLRLPRRRRARLPRGAGVGAASCARCRPTTAATRRCSTGWPRSSAAPRSATSGSGCCRSRPRTTAGWSTRRCRCSCGSCRATGCRSPKRHRDRSGRPATPSPRDLADRGRRPALRRRAACTRATARDQRPVQPGDIAVLVRTNSQAAAGAGAAARAPAYPSCSPARRRVFATPAAAEWQRLLEALEQPHRTTRVRRVALTCFVGLDAAGAGRGRRRLRRRPRAEAADLGRGAGGPRGRRDVRGGVARPGAAAADPRPGRRRAAAHRPAAHRAGACTRRRWRASSA